MSPAHRHFTISGLDGALRKIGVTSIPITGLKGEFLGRCSSFLGAGAVMRVTLLGARGSVAAPGPAMVRYGGNTSAVQIVSDDGSMLILDAGTGIRKLSEKIPDHTRRIDILLTHLHMDHIQGLGFFQPLVRPNTDVHMWGPPSSTHLLGERLARYLSPPLFPVHFRDLPAVFCHEVPENGFDIGPFSIRMSLVCHPDPTLGYPHRP